MRATFLLILPILAAPFGAFAQEATPTPYPTQPPPPPGWSKPDGVSTNPPIEESAPAPAPSPDPELRATEVLPDEMLRQPRSRPRVIGRPMVSPTLAIAIAARGVKNHDELATSSVDFWLGGRMHPFIAAGTPFVAFGAEINIRELPQVEPVTPEQQTTSYTEFVPEMRWGFAFLRSPHEDYFNVVFPNVELYGISGWRIANQYSGHALRLGVGVSAPIVSALSLACEVPLPAMLELTMDVDSLHSGDREFALRFGWHF